jgi:hypothetical protein
MEKKEDSLTKLEKFCLIAPPCPKSRVEIEQQMDRHKNPHNDSYKPKIRTPEEIDMDYRIEWAVDFIKFIYKFEMNEH